MELQELLALMGECHTSDTEDQQQLKQSPSPSMEIARPPHRQSNRNANGAGPKTRPRREVVEIAALQTQEAALTLELQRVKTDRLNRGARALRF